MILIDSFRETWSPAESHVKM